MATPTAPPDLNTPVSQLGRADFVRLFRHETVEEAMARLRREQIGERIIYFYVTADDGKLVGVVPTRRLLLASPTARIEEIMVEPAISISHQATLREAMALIAKRRLLALPLVDEGGHLVGVIDVGLYADEALDLERQETTEHLFQLVGVHIEQESAGGAFSAFRQRFLWLPANMASGLLAALIAGAFDHVLREWVMLAFFITVVLAIPESISMQSVTLSLHKLHLSEWGLPVKGGGTGREFRVGSLLGLATGLVVGLAGTVWLGVPQVGLVVAGSLLIASTNAALLGLLVPRLIHRWRLDPTVAAGPAVLALTDVQTLVVYFSLASLILLN